MKKSSLSLAAIVVMLSAITLAFTTKNSSVKPFTLSPGWHLAVADRNISGYTFNEADFNSSLAPHNPPTSSDCGGEPSKICAVRIDNSNLPAQYLSGGMK